MKLHVLRSDTSSTARHEVNYETDYNKVGGNETLKKIYEVDYFLIFPDMRLKQYWDLYVTLLVIFSCVITPWRLAFVESDDSYLWIIVDTLVDFFFVCDIFVNFFTVYSNEYEDYETNRKKIAVHYLKGWFLFDIVAILPINYFFNQGAGVNDLARLARLPRLYKLVKIFRIVKQGGKLKKHATEILKIGLVVERILTFAFILFITTHVLGCMWYYLARWDDFGPDTWVAKTNYQDKSDFDIYIYCFYFTITVITTVGYGDMPISTSMEKIVAIIIILIGVITFSFAIGSLISVLSNLDTSEAKLKEKHFELNSIRKKYRVPSNLYKRLFKALKFKIEQFEDIDAFMKTLPMNLKTDLTLEVNREIISKIPYFEGKDENFCAMAASFLKSSKTYIRDFIFQKGEPIYEIFFLMGGEAGYVVTEDDFTLVFCEIHTGNLFGELDFFSLDEEIPTGHRQFSVKALSD